MRCEDEPHAYGKGTELREKDGNNISVQETCRICKTARVTVTDADTGALIDRFWRYPSQPVDDRTT